MHTKLYFGNLKRTDYTVNSCLTQIYFFHTKTNVNIQLPNMEILNTVELGYSNFGCSDTLAIASNIEWY